MEQPSGYWTVWTISGLSLAFILLVIELIHVLMFKHPFGWIILPIWTVMVAVGVAVGLLETGENKFLQILGSKTMRISYYVVMGLLGLILAALSMFFFMSKPACFGCFPDHILDHHKENGCRVTEVAPHRVPKKPDGTVWKPLVLPVSIEDAIASTRKWCEEVHGEAATDLPIQKDLCNKPDKDEYTHIHYRMVTFLGFADDFGVKFTPLKSEFGATRIEVQSQSRVGVSDLGKNPARVAAFLKWMETQHLKV